MLYHLKGGGSILISNGYPFMVASFLMTYAALEAFLKLTSIPG